ncbi:MAG: SDR family oxidoreductase [Phototrophicales bacterium]
MMRIVITGANRGIGLELVRQYAQRDDVTVFAACRHSSAELTALESNRVMIIPLEVTDTASIQQAVAQVQARVSGLDVLINNAGINPSGQQLTQIEPDTMLTVYHVNTVAPLMLVKAFWTLLKNGQQPKIINISSSMGSLAGRTYGGNYAYCASKAALNMVSRGLAADLKQDAITVLALDPGWVQTDMGGQGATLTPQQSAAGILNVIDHLTLQDSGAFLRWDGSQHAW